MKRILSSLFLSACIGIPALASTDEFASTTIGIGNIVSDLDKSVEFYTKVVGMVKTGSFSVDEGFSKRSGLANGLPLEVTVLRLGEGDDATQWKLMTFGKKAKQQQSEFIYDNTGMQYITIMVKNLTPIVERIKAHKVKLLGDTPTALSSDTHFVLIQDPDGTFVELIGPMK